MLSLSNDYVSLDNKKNAAVVLSKQPLFLKKHKSRQVSRKPYVKTDSAAIFTAL